MIGSDSNELRGDGLRILGLSGLQHDTAAALLTGGKIQAAIEESKMVRSRQTSGIPNAAIGFCLKQAGIQAAELDYLAIATRPFWAWSRLAWMRLRQFPVAPIASAYFQIKGLGELNRELNNMRLARAMARNPRARIFHLDHHLCHAASAFYPSPFERALILTLDGQGDGLSGTVALGEGNRIRVLRKIAFPDSPAWVYSQVTRLFGFRAHGDEHKTQWLSLEGEPTFEKVFLEMLRRPSDLMPRLDTSYFNRGLTGNVAFSRKFFRSLGLESQETAQLPEKMRCDVASSLQHACIKIITELVESFRRQPGMPSCLALAGGFFLNPLFVAALEKETGFDQLFVQPAAANEGCSVGAAWLLWHHILGNQRAEPLSTLYWGPSYSSQEIKQALDNSKSLYRFLEGDKQTIDETVRLLGLGKIVAWHQGPAEFGPRALGNRSLLASPWAAYVKENLNDYIKHREPYRPFAISVPAEDAPNYFEYTLQARFMTSLAKLRPAGRQLLADFMLPGDRVRLHVVEQNTNSLLWQLLRSFAEKAPAPFLVNTSFNLFGEPLVIRPREAVRTFFSSGIDALVLGKFLLTK